MSVNLSRRKMLLAGGAILVASAVLGSYFHGESISKKNIFIDSVISLDNLLACGIKMRRIRELPHSFILDGYRKSFVESENAKFNFEAKTCKTTNFVQQ